LVVEAEEDMKRVNSKTTNKIGMVEDDLNGKKVGQMWKVRSLPKILQIGLVQQLWQGQEFRETFLI